MNPLRYFVTPIVLALITSACFDHSPGAAAERQFRIVAEHGTVTEQCDAARRVEAAYLAAEDKDRYAEWHLEAALTCLEAKRPSV